MGREGALDARAGGAWRGVGRRKVIFPEACADLLSVGGLAGRRVSRLMVVASDSVAMAGNTNGAIVSTDRVAGDEQGDDAERQRAVALAERAGIVAARCRRRRRARRRYSAMIAAMAKATTPQAGKIGTAAKAQDQRQVGDDVAEFVEIHAERRGLRHAPAPACRRWRSAPCARTAPTGISRNMTRVCGNDAIRMAVATDMTAAATVT